MSPYEQQTYLNIASLYEVKNETFVGTAHARPQSGKRISPSTFARSFALSFSAAQRFVHFTQASHTHATCRTRAERSALPPRLIPGYTKESEGGRVFGRRRKTISFGERSGGGIDRPSEERVTLSPLSSLLFLSLSAASSGLNRRPLSSKSRPTWMLVPCTTRKVVSW